MINRKKLITYLCTTGILVGTALSVEYLSSPKENTQVEAASFNEKEEIQNKMVNSIDNFSSAKGSLRYFSERSKSNYTIDFQVKTKENPVSYVKVKFSDKENENKEYKFDGNGVLMIDHSAKVYRLTPTGDNEIKKKLSAEQATPAKQRYFKDANGKIEGVSLREDPSYMGMASEVLFNQNIALGYLEDYNKWDIIGNESYLGFNAIVIAGDLSDNYKEKTGAERFKLWVDEKTGVLLKLEDYNADDKITFSITCTDLKLNTTLDDNKFKLDKPADYKEQQKSIKQTEKQVITQKKDA